MRNNKKKPAGPPKIGEKEEVKLNTKNIPYIARRSGVSKDELKSINLVRRAQGRTETTVRYTVIHD